MSNGQRFVNWVASSRKGILAGLIAGLVALAGSTDGGITAGEWIGALVVALGGGVVTYATPNRSKP